jgi:hypothetical protein
LLLQNLVLVALLELELLELELTKKLKGLRRDRLRLRAIWHSS